MYLRGAFGALCALAGTTLLPQSVAQAADLAVGPGQAFATISSAVAAASSGDRVLVDPGVYLEDITFGGKRLELLSTGGPGSTFLGGTTNTLSFVNGEAAGTRVVGFTVSGGSNSALRVTNASVSVEDCVLTSAAGQRVVEQTGGDLALTAGRVEGGRATYCVQVLGGRLTATDQVFSNNRGYQGGAVFQSNGTVIFDAATFTDNRATYTYGSGGAVYSGGGSAVVIDSTFSTNSAYYGGAVAAAGNAALVLRDSTLFGNSAVYGGGVSTTTQFNAYDTRFVENTATYGGGLFADVAALVGLVNDTFVGNRGTTSGGHVYTASERALLAYQTIFAFSGGGGAVYQSSAAARTLMRYGAFYSNIGGDFTGSAVNKIGVDGNLSADPTFGAYSRDADPSNDDLSLQPGSALIDAGDPDFLDLDGSTADLGAGGGDDDRLLAGAQHAVSRRGHLALTGIPAAMAAASSGQTVHVYPGVYGGRSTSVARRSMCAASTGPTRWSCWVRAPRPCGRRTPRPRPAGLAA